MIREYKEENFKKGTSEDIKNILQIQEKCNDYISNIIDRVIELDLTQEEKEKAGINISGRKEYHRTDEDSVNFVFAPGNTITFKRCKLLHGDEPYYVEYELECKGQLPSDAKIRAISHYGIVGSHTLFSYNESCEILTFDEVTEKKIRIIDGEDQLTQYAKGLLVQEPVFENHRYTFKYKDRDSYEYKTKFSSDGKVNRVYTDLEGKPLVQPEIIVTSFESFDESYTAFESKYDALMEIIDERLNELSNSKSK